jgi:DME family drug/metabolite transporter
MATIETARRHVPAVSYGTGILLVAMAGVLWSLQGLFIRQIDTAGAWAILFWRSVGMLPAVAVFLVVRSGGSPLAAIRRQGLTGVLGGLALVGAFGGAIYALQTTTVANAVFLFAASPLLAALIGRVVLHERVPARTWAAIAAAFVGILVMVGEGIAGGALAGSLAALVSALGFALFTVTLRRSGSHDTLPSVLLGGVFAATAGALAAAQGGETLLVPLPDVAWAIAMGAVALTGGMVLYTLGSKVIPAAQSTLLANVEVVLAPVWVWLFYGEGASAKTFVGGAIILSALVLNGLTGARSAMLARDDRAAR